MKRWNQLFERKSQSPSLLNDGSSDLQRLSAPWLVVALLLLFWLSAKGLEWEEGSGYRSALLSVSSEGRDGFVPLPSASTGVAFVNRLSDARSITNQVFLNGSGVAAGDVDGDGLCDLYFCGLDSDNALYLNQGNWRFEEAAELAGVGCSGQPSTGAVLADIEGDGDLDLLVSGLFSGVRLFLNDGSGRFRESTEEAGLSGGRGSHTMTLADVDGDGRLDLYVANYRNDTIRDMPDMEFKVERRNGKTELLSFNGRPGSDPDLIGRFSFSDGAGVLENGQADVLYMNEGGGRFRAVEWSGGVFLDGDGKPVAVPYDWGLSAMFCDLNGDLRPDLYVCNDFQSPDRIWMNRGSGRFQSIDPRAIRQTSLFSMGVDTGDLNGDGFEDFFVADMLSPDHRRRQVQVMDAMAFAQYRDSMGARPQSPRNTAFLNRGDATFSETAQFLGVDASDWSWCPVFMDVDLDGYEDLLITTGHWRDAQNVDVARRIDADIRQKNLTAREQLQLRREFPRLDTPNYAFRNLGGKGFERKNKEWGFDSRRVSQGMCLADLDGDGDLDAAVNCLNEEPLIYRNETAGGRIAVRLLGQSANTRGIGARVRVAATGLPVQTQYVHSGGRYLSGDDAQLCFAASHSSQGVEITVDWPSGGASVLNNVPSGRLYEIAEPSLANPDLKEPPRRKTEPLFVDVSDRLNHQTREAPFDDFGYQPLLPRSYSNLGPALAWFDFNSDGWQDLFIGSGRGGSLSVYRNDGRGGFIPQKAKMLNAVLNADLTSILAWKPAPGAIDLLAGVSHYERGPEGGPAVRRWSLNSGRQEDWTGPMKGSSGPLAMGDVDGDGDLDLFVGNRIRAGRFPESLSSMFYRNEGGELKFDPELSEAVEKAGMVSAAVLTDLNGDASPELVLACDWGAVRLFRNRDGRLIEWDPGVSWKPDSSRSYRVSRMSQLTGCWNSVASGDFDNDGRLDLALGNWGRNTYRNRYSAKPVELVYGDVRENGFFALMETHYDEELRDYVPSRDRGALLGSFPAIEALYPTFEAFSRVTVPQFRSDTGYALQETRVSIFDSLVLLNRGESFEARALPEEAQHSPAFGIGIGDWNGDGDQDLFLAQNFFGVAKSESRQDAGCGLVLIGDGTGDFRALSPMESGVRILGEGRSSAVCDFDRDGRLDIAVSQNDGPTRLLKNNAPTIGLRIRLEGGSGNPMAIGAKARLVYTDASKGPAHEVGLGAGYWAQHAREFVLGYGGRQAERIEIQWPNGEFRTVELDEEHPNYIRILQFE